jgi:putative sigma-54 modulation protein
MNIAITFRQMEPSDAVKQYAQEKVAKLQKFLRQPMQANVTLRKEKIEHVVEVRVAAGPDRFNGTERSEDMYASIDMVIDKLERQIRSIKRATVHKNKKKKGADASAQAVAASQPQPESEE